MTTKQEINAAIKYMNSIKATITCGCNIEDCELELTTLKRIIKETIKLMDQDVGTDALNTNNMNYKITITDQNNKEKVLTNTSTRPTAGNFWKLLDYLEEGRIKSFSISR